MERKQGLSYESGRTHVQQTIHARGMRPTPTECRWISRDYFWITLYIWNSECSISLSERLRSKHEQVLYEMMESEKRQNLQVPNIVCPDLAMPFEGGFMGDYQIWRAWRIMPQTVWNNEAWVSVNAKRMSLLSKSFVYVEERTQFVKTPSYQSEETLRSLVASSPPQEDNSEKFHNAQANNECWEQRMILLELNQEANRQTVWWFELLRMVLKVSDDFAIDASWSEPWLGENTWQKQLVSGQERMAQKWQFREAPWKSRAVFVMKKKQNVCLKVVFLQRAKKIKSVIWGCNQSIDRSNLILIIYS